MHQFPDGYRPILNQHDTEKAIKATKDLFEREIAGALKLSRVTSPLFVASGSGINDDLNGVERPVSFPVKNMGEKRMEIVQSLAKWKRMALADLGFKPGYGLYTDMNAIRPDDDIDAIHSIYVDQWDWERVIRPEDRNLDYLKATVRRIYEAIKVTENRLYVEFPQIEPILPDDIFFISSEELLQLYPKLSPRERETEICRLHKAVFVIGIGGKLSDGTIHDGRAADYDDWQLNGDILLWNPILESAFEVSSMGIRVSPESLRRQLAIKGESAKESLWFHKNLLEGRLPQTIGGGIGQSRLCMFLLRKAHIGEIQCSIWPEEMRAECARAGIILA